MVNPWWAVPSKPMVSTSICLLHCPPYVYYSLLPTPCSLFP
ncbi:MULTISPECIES: hypothetical protein [unclassified Moorena]|nr:MULTISPECIES: hypothetical protein [unclassified Moorena]